MDMGGGDMAQGLDQAHQDLMAGMADMNRQMDAGAAAADIDVAFVCSMIPHHQGAIDMARAVLRSGRNEAVRRLAQEIIVTQQDEIRAMRLAIADKAIPSTSPLGGTTEQDR
jgi:uncharacterized protein (DUF305 family)